jgi:hypothetical protein
MALCSPFFPAERPGFLVIAAAMATAAGSTLQNPAPDGFKNAGNAAKGIALIVPQQFDEIPVPPGTDITLLKFSDSGNRPKNVSAAEIRVFSIPQGVVATGGESRPASGPASRAGFKTFDEFVKKSWPGWKCGGEGAVEGVHIKKIERFALQNQDGAARAIAFVAPDDDRLVAVVGFCSREQFADLSKKFERSAKYLKIADPTDTPAAVDQLYKSGKFRGVEYRKAVRAALSKGWKAEDTENFILIYDVSDRLLINKLKHNLEVLRDKYSELFPPVREIVEVSTVRICKDRAEFLKFSELPPTRGWPGSGTRTRRSLYFTITSRIRISRRHRFRTPASSSITKRSINISSTLVASSTRTRGTTRDTVTTFREARSQTLEPR